MPIHESGRAYNPARQCHGKNTWRSKADAKRAIRRIQTVSTVPDPSPEKRGIKMQAYRCPHCNQFHIGRLSPYSKTNRTE